MGPIGSLIILYYRWALIHWGRVTHICVSNLTIIGSDNGLWPGRRQAIIWTNAGILSIGTLGTNFNEILIKLYTFSFIWKCRLEMAAILSWPQCVNVYVNCFSLVLPRKMRGLFLQSICLVRFLAGSFGTELVKTSCGLWPLLLTWFNFNPSMDK